MAVKNRKVDEDRLLGPLDRVIEYLQQVRDEAQKEGLIVSLEDYCGIIRYFDFHESCQKCNDCGYTVVCGWCESNIPHGSCDDTFTPRCDCVIGRSSKD